MGYSPWGRKELDTAERLTLTLADPACLFVVCFLVSSSSLEKPCGSVQSVCPGAGGIAGGFNLSDDELEFITRVRSCVFVCKHIWKYFLDQERKANPMPFFLALILWIVLLSRPRQVPVQPS